MISAWLDLPSWLIVLSLASGFGVTALLFWLLLFRLLPRERVLRHAGLVAPYFTAFSVMFALLTGFTANDTWERNRNAANAVLAEQDALLDVYSLSVAAVAEMAEIRHAERHYIELVVKDEWPGLSAHIRSAAADRALGALLSLVADPAIGVESGSAVQTALVQSVLRVRSARLARLSISTSHSDGMKWLSVLMLALLTQFTLALTHLEKARPHLIATLLYAVAVVVALGPVATSEHPFGRHARVTPAPLEAVHTILVHDAR